MQNFKGCTNIVLAFETFIVLMLEMGSKEYIIIILDRL
jgi:hypothetical protein